MQTDCNHEIKKCLLLRRKAMTNLAASILKSRAITFPTEVITVVMYGCELDHKDGTPKNWCFWTVVLQKTLESPLDCNEIKPINPKSNQSWIFIERTDVEAEAPILWPPDSLEKTLMLGKTEGGRRRGRQEDWDGWMASPTRWTWLWANSRDSTGQRNLACCSPQGHKELDVT